jgi:hypothetical protein
MTMTKHAHDSMNMCQSKQLLKEKKASHLTANELKNNSDDNNNKNNNK